jgi:Arc/MetJ-type ribon-helix-helix transcriptional regulator
LGKRKDLTYWNIPVTKSLDSAVEEAVEKDMHVSKSDLIRDAVRQLLKQIGVPEKEVPSNHD